ncbi:methionine--tRNA ligase, mitochondrial isoform X2 [Eurytemora carolleeae]|uniref:methionine--tRNA ligase, mitochondrial isoform X2 n=1 Tax=Eurytemora carolleeae TaxID=1294199 RepID=UPI000C765695|nr:methionine--tRNA ligase, mitochondrial isoform X2 [Eurytemora carolleeae]|eukprot:XP_023349424.1 methionine--tRNA ligase, mitochondrial-like isoform X2 [Eurytemora affinis]
MMKICGILLCTRNNKKQMTSLISNFKRSIGNNSDYFITTPIFYVNSAPHIGHLYSALLADAHYRFRRLKEPNKRGIFSTGTDEHGLKIQQAAASAGITPDQLCREVSGEFRSLFDEAGISYTDFIRTTELRHKTVVDSIWKQLYASGNLYRTTYSSWYSVQDEAFLTSTQVEERDGVHYSLESGHRVEWASEENWCFRLSDQKEKILKWLKDCQPIQPAQFQGQVSAWLEDEKFGDLSVSRPKSRLKWGISAPDSEDEIGDTIYVWLDALANYLTVAGYKQGEQIPIWPPSVHVIGKDILKFHAIYWPGFLSALELPLPRKILVHSHWMVDDVKMSKSLGNVLNPHDLITKYGVDGTRYMLLREGVPHMDGNFCHDRMLHYLNHELADTLGNLLNRSCSNGVNPSQIIPDWNPCFQGIVLIMDVLRLTNLFVQEEKPWELKKMNPERLNFVLALSLESLRVCGILLQPIVPSLAHTLLSKLMEPTDTRLFIHCKHHPWQEKGAAKGPQTTLCGRGLRVDKVVLFKKIR